MSRVAKLIWGNGVGGAWLDPDEASLDDFFEPIKNMVQLQALGCFQRNVFAGGIFELDGSANGTFDLPGWLPIAIDNSGSQLTGFTDPYGATMVIQFRFLLYVTNSAINVTPRIYDVTAAAAATTTGAVACSTTESDYNQPTFTGSNQQQTLALTPATASHIYKPQLTIAGTPAAGYRVKGIALYDCFINS